MWMTGPSEAWAGHAKADVSIAQPIAVAREWIRRLRRRTIIAPSLRRDQELQGPGVGPGGRSRDVGAADCDRQGSVCALRRAVETVRAAAKACRRRSGLQQRAASLAGGTGPLHIVGQDGRAG